MKSDRKDTAPERLAALEAASAARRPKAGHVVFDFTGLERPGVGDLSLVLTARLQSAPADSVWVRSLPAHTERVLRLLRLDHLFRTYPEGSGDLN
jgi:hypothetical protein